MRVVLYPADDFACGNVRLNWPGRALAEQGHDVTAVDAPNRRLKISVDQRSGSVSHVEIDDGIDVIVFQRTTHLWIAQAVVWLRERGYSVVVDVDDDLHAIHPDNPAHDMLDPVHMARGKRDRDGRPYLHSWDNLAIACRAASLVTCSTPGLLRRYARHGRGVVLPNYLAEHYYTAPLTDSRVLGWPASIHSHPNDPTVVGSAVARVVAELGVEFRAFGETEGVARAFRLPGGDPAANKIPLDDWPAALAQLGVGIAPLADTVFNSRKSWLKPLELAAAGTACVMSSRVEYRRLHEQHGIGLIADSARQWYELLRRLLRDDQMRIDVAARAREASLRLRLGDHLDEYWGAWTLAARIDAGERVPAAAGS